VPAPLAALVAQNLSKDPGARRRDARELGRALVAAAHESGLSPEDLLPRSTLLGSRPALRLASLERTKAMPLKAAPSGPRGTAIVEPDPEPQRTKAGTTPEPVPERAPTRATTDPGLETRSSGATPEPANPPAKPGPSQPGDRARPSTVDATLSEAHEAHWDSLPPERPSPADQRRLAIRRGTLIAACFAAGAAVALLAANGLGAFDEPEPGPSSYVLRARAALARGDILTPRNENVKDITDTALGVWPKHAELLSARAEAASRLFGEARALPPERREKATQLLSAALELNPDDPEIRRLLTSLSAPPSEPPRLPSAAPSAPRKPPKPEKRAAAPETVPAPAPQPSAEPPNVNVGAEPAPSSGRWL
jgi:hypothetical protein